MALHNFDSFHGYTNDGNRLLSRYVTVSSIGGSGTGRFPGTSYIEGNGGNHAVITAYLNNIGAMHRVAIDQSRPNLSLTTFVYGVANNIVGNSSAEGWINNASVFFGVVHGTDGFFRLRKGNTVLATSTNTFTTLATYRRLEIEATVSASGTFKLYVGGALEIDYSGDLVGAVTGSPKYFSTAGQGVFTSSFYIWNDTNTGDGWTGYMGDFQPVQLLPNGAGSSSQSTVTGAPTRHEAVDDTFRNGATDYVTLATNGHKDLYTYTDVGVSGTIHSVVLQPSANLGGSGSAKIKAVVKSGATEVQSADSIPLETIAGSFGSLPLTVAFPTDPDTTVAWTTSGVNAAEFGVSAVLS